MKRAVVFVFVAVCVVSALSLAEDKKKSKPPGTLSPAEKFQTSPSSQSTTHTPKHTTTTPKPTTTTPKPTTTTPKPKTTTPKPKTTTPKPTTTTPKPKTTTPKPTTTTPKPKTTTPKPTTPPSPQPTPPTNLTVGNYTVKTDKGTCVMALMALQIRLATPTANGTFIVQPRMAKPEGNCDATVASLTISFKEGFIGFTFNKSVADNFVYVSNLSFQLTYPFIKGGKAQHSAKNNSLHLFSAKVGHSYSCKKESFYMGNGLYLDVTQNRLQAFNLTKNNEFGFPDHCPADQPDYRVAIAVGVTLLVLIVIVVVAYLLSRRRRSDGYQTL